MIYDVSSRKVATLVNGWRSAGYHEVTFNASHLASGIYFSRLEAGDFSAIRKMALVK
ncbi:T9SS type A sorting domain-containing protein [bacterium]|nr:T9SS type A sorting domain-containing protein [bacterium]